MVEIVLLFAKDLLIPLGLMFWQFTGKYRDKAFALLMTVLAGAYVGFVYISADWAIYGYYVKYILAGLFLFTTGSLLRRIRTLPFYVAKPARQKLGQWIMLFFLLFFTALDLWAVWGMMPPAGAVSLAFPFRNGTFYVLEGGNSPVLNNAHHARPPVPQKYAVDIIQLNHYGSRASGFFPSDPAEYAIFGATVYSPVSGQITSVVDSFPDSLTPSGAANDTTALGNHLAIAFDRYEVVLAQLQQGSIRVKVGDFVREGQAVAAAGSSGEVSEPHLHIHLTEPATDSYVQKYWSRSGVPILFEGRFPVKNDRILIP